MSRRVAILIDGGFFLKRLPKLVPEADRQTAEGIATSIKKLCRSHVRQLTGVDGGRWQDEIYRIFFYDAVPFTGVGHHPLENRQIDFGKSDTAVFRQQLFDCLRRQRKVALRLGKVNRESDWSPPAEKVRKILQTRAWIDGIDFENVDAGQPLVLTEQQLEQARRIQNLWRDIRPEEVRLGLRQKGVDMRIGLDIASITLKQQAQTIVLVAGDSDFVPAAKLARREGREFVLDPLWQGVNADLLEHIDCLQSGFPKPRTKEAVTGMPDAGKGKVLPPEPTATGDAADDEASA